MLNGQPLNASRLGLLLSQSLTHEQILNNSCKLQQGLPRESESGLFSLVADSSIELAGVAKTVCTYVTEKVCTMSCSGWGEYEERCKEDCKDRIVKVCEDIEE